MKITFLGGAGTVTGSKYLLESSSLSGPLLVDCGLFQGIKYLRLKNWEPFPFDPQKLSGVILTHAHLDHSGAIPLLIKQGYSGPIYCSEATFELCRILLKDAGYLQEEEARYANKRGFSKHKPALPLYTRQDAEDCFPLFKPIQQHQVYTLNRQVNFQLLNAGHILGASMVQIHMKGKSWVFSGDLGRPQDPVIKPPAPLPQCDYLVLESTYGNRIHEKINPLERLKEIIDQVWKNKSVVIMPSFAVGRTQTLLYLLSTLKKQRRLPDIPIYLNSPMATEVTKLFCKYHQDHRLSEHQCRETCDIATYVHTAEESRELNSRGGPMIIISASGMATGGRVVHHLKSFIGNPENFILFAGFQAAGTRGASMIAGAQEIKIHGQYYPVRAKILCLDMLSAHADFKEILTWLKASKIRPSNTFITHGEPSASDNLRRVIEEELGWNVTIPLLGEARKLE